MLYIQVRFRPEVRRCLEDEIVKNLFWKLQRLVASECGVSILQTEANELPLGVSSNATCVHVWVDFDPEEYFELIAPGYGGDYEEIPSQIIRDFCDDLRDKLLGLLANEPLLEGCGVNIVSAQVLKKWYMREYLRKQDSGGRSVRSFTAGRLVNGVSIDLTTLAPLGYTVHNQYGHAIVIPTREENGTYEISVIIHTNETFHVSMEGLRIQLVHPVSQEPIATGMLDYKGGVQFTGISSGLYSFRITPD